MPCTTVCAYGRLSCCAVCLPSDEVARNADSRHEPRDQIRDVRPVRDLEERDLGDHGVVQEHGHLAAQIRREKVHQLALVEASEARPQHLVVHREAAAERLGDVADVDVEARKICSL